MDLEALFTMADNIPRPVTDPLGFHVTDEQFLGVDFLFFPATHASVDMKEASGLSHLDEPIASGPAHVQQSTSSALIDSDDDFGDFTSVPADTLHEMDVFPSADPFGYPVNTTFELDVGNSYDMFGSHTSSMHLQLSPAQEDLFGHLSATVETLADESRAQSSALPAKPLDTNSDDDWGDFVEHSTSAIWDNSQEFNWFDTTQQNVGGQSESIARNVNDTAVNVSAWENGVWTGPSKVEVQKSEQKATNFAFDDLGFFGGGSVSISKGSKVSLKEVHDVEGLGFVNDEMPAQQKTSALQRTLSGQSMGKSALNSVPIPLSLFGESELEVENANTELLDPVTTSFQGHSRSKSLSTGSFQPDGVNLSDLIATLYTESQPDVQIKNLQVINSAELNETKDSVNKVNTGVNLFDTVTANDGSSGIDLFDTVIANNGMNSLEERMFNLSLSLGHAADLGFLKEAYDTPMGVKLGDAAARASDDNQSTIFGKETKGSIDMSAGTELQSQEATTLMLLDSTSTADRCTFVNAWASILAVCASELELALNIWKQAQNADVHLNLLADLQGKKYFAAIGQVYVVALILAATSNFYKPWLRLASKEAESLQADLERCKAAWMQTNLKEGVRLALDGLQGSVPTTVVSWKGIEGFAAVALEAYSQAAKASVHSICRMSLLPMASFNYAGLPPVEWFGSSYLLPLANMWVNCVSCEPPSTSFITQLKTL